MKKNKYHILLARLLLFIFAAGQVIVYGHQHKGNAILAKPHSSSSQTITENCQLCDAMHFNAMDIGLHQPVMAAVVSRYNYQTVTYSFVSLSLILSTGRAPPLS